MNIKIYLNSILFFSLLFSNTIAFSAGAYKCKVLDAKTLSDKGYMVENHNMRTDYLGKEFFVDKISGRMTGEKGMRGWLINYNDFAQPRIIDKGSTSSSYKVITIYSAMERYLHIQEFQKQKNKPFLFLSRTTTVSGICVAY